MPKIHPTAIVSAEVEMGEDVEVGAYAIVEGRVRLGAGTVVLPHTVMGGPTTVGRGCRLGPAAYVGLAAQHLRADPHVGSLVIGDRVTIRETATVHRSTDGGHGDGDGHATRLGDDVYIMGGVHVAHDCVLGDGVICANAALLGGHTVIGAKSFLGGGSAFHQFAHVGRLVIVGGNETVTQGVPPFAAVRYRALKGYNAVGCKRAGMSAEAISGVRAAYRCLHEHRTTPGAVAAIRASVADGPEVREILDFIAVQKRGIVPSASFRTAAMADG